MKVLEYRMKQGCFVHSPRLKSMMQNFGKPDICEVAQKESILLARTKYWSRRTPEKKLPKIFKKLSPTVSKQDRIRSFSVDEKVAIKEKSPAAEVKQKRSLSLNNRTKVEKEVSAKKHESQKKSRRRINTDHSKPQPQTTSRSLLRKRSLCSSDTEAETENLRPSSEESPNSKRTRLARGQLFEGNFVLSDENRAEQPKPNPTVLVDSSAQNNSIESKPARNLSKDVDMKRDKTSLVKKSPLKACRNVTVLRRRLRRKSSPSYFCAKQYQCYVLY